MFASWATAICVNTVQIIREVREDFTNIFYVVGHSCKETTCTMLGSQVLAQNQNYLHMNSNRLQLDHQVLTCDLFDVGKCSHGRGCLTCYAIVLFRC